MNIVLVALTVICTVAFAAGDSCTKAELEDGQTKLWKLSKNVPKALKGSGSRVTLNSGKDSTLKIAVKNDIAFDVLQMCLRVRNTEKVVFRFSGEKGGSRKTVEIDRTDQEDWKKVCSRRVLGIQAVSIDLERAKGGKSQVASLFLSACIRDRTCGSLSKGSDLFKLSSDAEQALNGNQFTAKKNQDVKFEIKARNEGSLEVEKLCFQVRGSQKVTVDLPGRKKTFDIIGEDKMSWRRICVNGQKKEDAATVVIRFDRSKGLKVRVRGLEMDACVRSLPGK